MPALAAIILARRGVVWGGGSGRESRCAKDAGRREFEPTDTDPINPRTGAAPRRLVKVRSSLRRIHARVHERHKVAYELGNDLRVIAATARRDVK
jgi:hypothetical protein